MANFPLFRDRTDAGEQLAQVIDATISQAIESPPQVVYALPRGGLPVALPIARKLKCPLSVIVSKKISHPKNPELAIGAVTTIGNVLWNEQNPYPKDFEPQTALQQAVATAEAQMAQFNPACPQVSATGAVAIIVDDGIATGMTIAVAAQAIKKQQPAAIWLCAPVAPPSLLSWLQTWGDRLVILHTPESFFSVSHFYQHFEQVKTIEAIACLHQQYDWLSKTN
ncbi:phosphoribosyltransferase [Aliterella atlantica]|uniref:Phosphoribosyltransferase n=1 Tax=Aliterella atlantica CENA595 TaxID=1618023 RepID=A0A0D8ZYI7_9CYAN|nr:phosphoribosyltransferase family protein [Aliterella atlantica]KJH73524.1 phosphoribosyltransferase [Aliterella atlantica CENA595]